MTVIDFDTDKGLYMFQLNALETELHSHPAIEIIISERGFFSVETERNIFSKLNFAIIDANVKHKILSGDCNLKIIIVEYHTDFIKSYLLENNMGLTNGFYFNPYSKSNIEDIDSLVIIIAAGKALLSGYDSRVILTIDYIKANALEYSAMIRTLQDVTRLSESRLSHLFKNDVGISLKKYLVWSKLKTVIKQHLNHNDDLFTALLKSGFYDHPHFSKSFKSFFGIKPSGAYNSRTLQV